jgi:hypothetical protein
VIRSSILPGVMITAAASAFGHKFTRSGVERDVLAGSCLSSLWLSVWADGWTERDVEIPGR